MAYLVNSVDSCASTEPQSPKKLRTVPSTGAAVAAVAPRGGSNNAESRVAKSLAARALSKSSPERRPRRRGPLTV